MAHHGDLLLNKRQAKSYRIIKVARDEDLFEQIGKDINFDLVDHDKVHSFRIKKHRPFHFFKEEVAKEFGVPVQFQRFWLWAKRQNHTYRPNRPLTPQEESQSVGQLREVTNKAYNAELKLLLEVELGLDLQPSLPLDRTKEDIMLFFKLYDPEKEELRYVGRLFVKGSGKPLEVLAKLNEMAGFSPEEEIELYEEIKFEPTVMCEHIDKKLTFRSSQLEDGDIICFQKPPPVDNQERCSYPDVPSFLEYVHNLQVVHFRSLEKPKEEDFCLELSKIFTYDDVTKKVARQLGLDDATKIRLTSHNCNSQQPKPQPIKYRGVNHLSDMLVHYNQTFDILYYEVLDIPLPELQGLKTLKVAFHHATKDEVVIHSIRLPKQSTVGDVINDLKTKVELSNPDAELRLLEVFYHKIYKIFPLAEKIQNINDQYWKLRAEEIPEEEKNPGPQDCLIHVYHFTKDPSQNQMQVQNFGKPFFLIIHEGETLAEVKLRIQKKLQVPDEEFSKWKIAYLSFGRPDYLQDSDIVFNRFQRRDLYGAWEQYLGLEHSDSAPKRAYAANQIEKCSEKESSWSSEVSVSMPSSGSSKGGFAVQTLATDLQVVGIAENSMTTPQTGGVSENLITRVAEANAQSSVTLPSQTEGVANLVTPQSDIHSISRSAQIASQQDQDLFALDYFSVSSEGSHSSFKELTDVSGFKVPTKFASLYKSVHTRYGHIATTKVLRNSTSALILKVTDILKVIEAMACRRVSDLDITTLEYWDGHIQDAEALQFNVTWLRERLDSVSDEWKKVTELRNSVATSDTALKSAIMHCDTLEAFVQDLQKQFDLVTQTLDEAKSALNNAENQVQVEQEALRAGMEQHALLQSLIQNTLLHDL